MEPFNTFIRPEIARMAPYTPIVPFEVLSRRLGRSAENIIKLDANENPYGASQRVYAALGDVARSPLNYHIYPDPGSTALREALSEYTGIDASYLVAGHGADELIDLVIRLFIAPGDVVLNCPPTFGMYPFDTELNGGRVVNVPRRSDFSVDVEGVVSVVERYQEQERDRDFSPKLLFLTSPNNPDGGLLGDDELRELLGLPLIVVLDEAYIEFASPATSISKKMSMQQRRMRVTQRDVIAPTNPSERHANNKKSRAQWVLEHENLIVLRTFSKWAGLAGLRVGYGIFPLWLVSELLKIKQPYNVNVAGAAAAIASLQDVAYLMENVRRIVEERERLFAALEEVDFLEPVPSHANFLLCRVLRRTAAELHELLAKQGILVRYFETPGLREYVRISVGKPEETAALLQALTA